MHTSNLMNARNKSAQIYTYLRERPFHWHDAWELSQRTQTTCLSTHVAAINQELRERGMNAHVEHERRGKHHYYRLEMAIAAKPAA